MRLVLAIALALIAACDGGAPAVDAARPDAAPADAAPADAAPADAAPADAAPGPDAHLVVASCAEAGASDCFSSYDCVPERRCQNLGTELDPVPCCVPGARGTAAAGESCAAATGELTCASAICIEGATSSLCSTICGGDAGPCPGNMPTCMPIAFSGSDDSWCFPE
jgi:hypothetical protein